MHKIVPNKGKVVGNAKASPPVPQQNTYDDDEEEEEEIYVPLPPDCKELKSIYFGFLPCVPKHEKDPDSPGVLARFCPDNYRYCVRLCRTKCCKIVCKCCCGVCSMCKFVLFFVNSIFLIAGLGLMGMGVYGVMKFDMGAGLLGAASLGCGLIGAGSVFFALLGIQGARLRRMEGMTECGQCLLCFYQFGIAGIMVVELLLALVLMFWATNQMGIITDLQGGDVSEGSLTHTINYNLGNNFVNCSFNDCCPPLLEKKKEPGFRTIVDGIYELNDTWPEATCVRPGDECTDEKREQGLCEEELALAPATDAVNNSNTIVSPSSSSGEIITQDNENEGGNANAGSAPSSGAALTDADVEPLQQAEHNGRQQMCMLFEPVQNKENCWDLELYDKKLREYFWGLLEPFSTVILVVVVFELLGFVGAWFSLCWCCGAGSMKLDIEDSDDDEHEWDEDEHENVPAHLLHSV